MRSSVLPCSLALLFATSAFAGPPADITILPSPSGAMTVSPNAGARAHAVCTPAYSNYAAPAGAPYVAGTGVEVFDDLHLAVVGDLCAFGYTYSGPSADVIVTFYANDGPLGSPGTVIAGPFVAPSTAGRVEFEVPGGITTIGPDLWMGFVFPVPDQGLLFTDPPSIGSSGDVIYQRPPDGFITFGGNPVANFRISVDVDLPTPVRPSTWGTLKTIYRD